MLTDYIVPALAIGFVAWRILSPRLARRRLPALRQQGAQMVDVRSDAEFATGHAPGSVNIPLPDIARRAGELDRNRPVVVCCASGTRSAIARLRLKRLGFAQVVNAGPWPNLL